MSDMEIRIGDTGIQFEFYDEQVALGKPAEIHIYTDYGLLLARIEAKCARQMGADGGMYPAVEFEHDEKSFHHNPNNPLEILGTSRHLRGI